MIKKFFEKKEKEEEKKYLRTESGDFVEANLAIHNQNIENKKETEKLGKYEKLIYEIVNGEKNIKSKIINIIMIIFAFAAVLFSYGIKG